MAGDRIGFEPQPAVSLPDLSPDPADTYTSPSEITVDSKGRVTSVTEGGGGAAYHLTGGAWGGALSGGYGLSQATTEGATFSGTDIGIVLPAAGTYDLALAGRAYFASGEVKISVRKWNGSAWSTVLTLTLTSSTQRQVATGSAAWAAGDMLALNVDGDSASHYNLVYDLKMEVQP